LISLKFMQFNIWYIIFIILVIVVILGVFIVLDRISQSNQAYQLTQLDQACASYGNTLTQELSSNQTLSQLENISVSPALANLTRNSVLYCTYSYNCANVKPVIPNSLSCLCNVLQSNKVILSGLCIKQQLS